MSQEETPISLEKFRAWLEGVEEMQEENWTPTETQWKKIRSKIDLIQETVQQVQAPVMQQPVMQQPMERPPMAGFETAESLFDNAPQAGVRPPPPAMERPKGPVATFEHGSGAVKTPDMDTSDGQYTSTFL